MKNIFITPSDKEPPTCTSEEKAQQSFEINCFSPGDIFQVWVF
jgi:hypothetical protein